MATRIGIMAEIGLDGRGFNAGLLGAEKSLSKFARRAGAYLAGMFSIGAISSAIKNAVQRAGNIRDMADAIGLTAEQYQELEFAAKQTGTTMDVVSAAIKRIAQAQQEALTGKAGNAAQLTFERLGMTMEEIKSIGPHEIFRKIGDSLHEGTIGMKNMADLLDIMGKQSNSLFPMMIAGLAEMGKQARDFGLITQEGIIDQLDEVGDKLDVLSLKWQNMAASGTVWLKSYVTGLRELAVYFHAALTGYSDPDKLKQTFEAIALMFAEEDAALADMVTARKVQQAATAKAMRDAGLQFKPADIKATTTKPPSFSPPTDELARIGGFIGGTGTSQVNILRNIERYVGRTAVAGEQTVRKLENL